MPIYRCRVVDARGRTASFVREAAAEEVLIRELNQEQIHPLEVRLAEEAPSKGARRRRLSRAAVLEFTQTVSVLLASGLTFRDSLEVAQGIFLKGEVNRMVAHLLQQIRKGASVSEAIGGLGAGLPPVYRGFLRVGEKVGSLEEAFRRLAAYLAEDGRPRDKLSASLLYPLLVLSVAAVGVTGIVVFVLPRLQAVFLQLGLDLPARLASLPELLRWTLLSGAALAAAALAAGWILSVRRRTRPALALSLDRLALRLPIYGRWKGLREMLNLLFAMESLGAGGFSGEDALAEAAGLTGNQALRGGLEAAREGGVRGENLSALLLDNPLFPARIGRWGGVGERAGQVEPVFAQLRQHYQAEIEKWCARFTALVEPVLILGVGLIIFLIVVFFITPIFSIYEGFL